MSGLDRALRQAVDRLRRRRLTRILLEGAGAVVGALLLAVSAAVLVTALLGPGSNAVVTARVIGYVVIGAAAARYLVAPCSAGRAIANLRSISRSGSPRCGRRWSARCRPSRPPKRSARPPVSPPG
jgi:hypothetical protein